MTKKFFQDPESSIKSGLIYLLESQDIHQISVTELSNIANVSRATFYLYYDDKFQVLEEIEIKTIQEIDNINKNFHSLPIDYYPDDQPIPFFYETYKFIDQNIDTFRALLGPCGSQTFTTKWKKQIECTFTKFVSLNNIDLKYKEYINEISASILISSGIFYTFKGRNLSPTDMSTIAGRAFISLINSFK